MKRNLLHILFPALFVGVALFAGCADDAIVEVVDMMEEQQEEPKHVWRLKAGWGGDNEKSRLAYHYFEGTFMTTWEKTDQLAANAYPGEDTEKYAYIFNLIEGSGSSYGVFECDSFPSGIEPENLKSKEWTIYYPGSRIQSEEDFFNMTYDGQVQHGNGNFGHIKDFHASRLTYGDKVTEVTLDNALLEFNPNDDDIQESACMMFNLSGLPAIVPVKLQLEYLNPNGEPEKIFYTHNYSSSYWGNKAPIGSTTSILSMELADFAATSNLTALMMMSSYPVEVQKGGTFRIYVTDVGGDVYSCDKAINRDAVLEGGLMHQINYDGEWIGGSEIDGMTNPEGGIFVLHEATKGTGTDIVIMGDGFAKEHFEDGNYESVMKDAYEAFFSVEPYASLKDYFNVYYINAVSAENHDAVPYWSGGSEGSGAQNGATMGTAKTKFGTTLKPGSTFVDGNYSLVIDYAYQAIKHKGGKGGTPLTDDEALNRRAGTVLALVQVNVKCYAGTCHFSWTGGSDYGNATSVAYTPLGNDGTGRQMRLTTIHEAGGHGFKLADEYQGMTITGFGTGIWTELRNWQSCGVFRNVNEYWTEEDAASFTGVTWDYTTTENVYWAELLRSEYDYTTTEGLSLYKGAKTYNNLFCRPTDNSVMRNQFGTDGQSFNAISRWAIWYRVMRLTNSTSATNFKASLDEFIAFDKTIQGWGSSSTGSLTTGGENFVEQKLEPLAPPVVKEARWVNGRLVELE